LSGNQLERLRRIRDEQRRQGEKKGNGRINGARRLSVTSGKGGVGKSSFALNTAIALASMKQKVLLIDADTNLANLDIMLGISPKHNLSDVIIGGMFMKEIIIAGPGGIDILPGASDDVEMVELETEVRQQLVESFDEIEKGYNYVIIDTGAGLNPSVIDYILSSDEVIVVTNPEPTAFSDAYKVIKVVSLQSPTLRIKLLVNNVKSRDQAIRVWEGMNAVVQSFINRSIEYLGHLPTDPAVAAAVSRRSPLVLEFPRSPAAREIRLTARKLLLGKSVRPVGERSLFARLFKVKTGEYEEL
jgi:flagellar biosynthesis protein FlhG